MLGLPRGGVAVAFEIACALEAPLDVFVVRKLGVPGQRELAMGALASGGMRVLNREVVEAAHLGPEEIEQATVREQATLERQEALLRAGRPSQALAGRAVIVVDDGLATGATMRAAIAAVRGHAVSSITVAVPVSPPETCASLRGEVDELVCCMTPEPFVAVGVWYRDFAPVSDQEVRELLERASAQRA